MGVTAFELGVGQWGRVLGDTGWVGEVAALPDGGLALEVPVRAGRWPVAGRLPDSLAGIRPALLAQQAAS